MHHIFDAGMWNTPSLIVWFFASYLYHTLGITLGYHRLLTHKSVKVPRWLKYIIVSGGYLSLMGSPIVLVGVHRLHHQKSDSPGDPHSPRDGFWHAMYGWMFEMYEYQTDEELQRAAGDLMEDPVFRMLGTTHAAWQAQLCLGINIVVRLAMFAVLGFWPTMIDIVATLIIFSATQCVNSVCHLDSAGYRLFDTREGSRNVWWVAILTCGEGWHNNHHALPKSARHGLAWWEVDVTFISIWILEKLGLGKDVVRPPAHKMPGYKGTVSAAATTAEPAIVPGKVPPQPLASGARKSL